MLFRPVCKYSVVEAGSCPWLLSSSQKASNPRSTKNCCGTFRELDEVCSEVSEDSRVLRVRRLWFPTSDRLQTLLIPSGTTRSRHYNESTTVWRNLPPYHCFWYFVLSFSSKRAWQSGSKHYQRWYEGRLRQTMLTRLDRTVPERMRQVSRRLEVGNHKRRTVSRWTLRQMGILRNFWHYVYRKTFSSLRISKNPFVRFLVNVSCV